MRCFVKTKLPLAGAVLLSALTLLVDWAFTRLERWVVPPGVSDEARLAAIQTASRVLDRASRSAKDAQQ